MFHCSLSDIRCIIQRQNLKLSITPLALLHMHEHKILVSSSAQCSLHNSAGMSLSVGGDSQSSRRRTRGNSIASKASAPNDTEVSLAKQTPFLHWQILTFTVCSSPKPCRSLMSTGTLCIPLGSALICSNVAAVSGEEAHEKKKYEEMYISLRNSNATLCRAL